ncbi:hypothetical protein KKG61_02825 [bacterium]|nr:hypothetical protein [bacterium]
MIRKINYKITALILVNLLLLPIAKEVYGSDYLKITSLSANPSTISQGGSSTFSVSLKEYVDFGGWWGGVGWTKEPTVEINIAGRTLYAKRIWSRIGSVGEEYWWMPWPWGPILLYYYQYSWWRFETVWDGKDNNGNFVGPGEYPYNAYAIFPFGADSKEGKITVISPITICDSNWKPLAWDEILKVGGTLYLQAIKEKSDPNLQESIVVTVKSNITNPEGIQVTLTETTPTSDLYRGSTIIVPSLVATGEDEVDEFASADITEPNDSDTFAAGMSPKKNMGEARKEGDEDKMTPSVNLAFMQSAGIEKLTAIYGDTSDTAFCKNQADWFYYSGHGYCRDLWWWWIPWLPPEEPERQTEIRIYEGDKKKLFGYKDAQGKWNENLDTVIFAACSVLDVNDYNGNYNDDWWPLPEQGPSDKIFPGEKWATVGPKHLLGYNYYAPLGPIIDTEIINRWLGYLPIMGRTRAWLEANAKVAMEEEGKGRHACAINEMSYWYLKSVYDSKRGKWRYKIIGPIPRSKW